MKYEIIGGNLPVAICKLNVGDEVCCEGGAMSWMDDGIRMHTEGGGLGKMFGRAFSGESMFRNRYVAERAGEIAFSSKFPGDIKAVELSEGRSFIIQKKFVRFLHIFVWYIRLTIWILRWQSSIRDEVLEKKPWSN